jgi:hypothetical protein
MSYWSTKSHLSGTTALMAGLHPPDTRVKVALLRQLLALDVVSSSLPSGEPAPRIVAD